MKRPHVLAADGVAVLAAVQAVVVALLVVVVAGLLRSHAAIVRALHDLGADPAELSRSSAAPFRTVDGVPGPGARRSTAARDVAGAGLRERAVVIPVVDVPHRTALVFLSSGCLTCERFWDAFRAGEERLPDDVRLVIVTKDATEESESRLRELAPQHLPVVMSSDAWRDFEVPGSPYAVLVDGATGEVIGEGTGLDWPSVASMLAEAAADARLAGTTARHRDGVPRRQDEREREIDRVLHEAGIDPGHASLYGPPTGDDTAPGAQR